MKRGSLSVILAILVASPVNAYAAPTKEACISAFDQAQQLRRAGHLRQSREQLVVCSQSECPKLVRADCADVLRQVEAAQPTIVLKASDAKGADLTDVRVEVDGQTLARSLDGRAIAVDPGKLSIVFHRPPWKAVGLDVVVAEGEKGRVVQVTLGPPAPKPRVETSAPVPPERGVIGWVVPAGLGLLGLGSLAAAGVSRLDLGSEADDLRARCAPACPQEDRDRMSSQLVTTNVMLGVGVGALALATMAWFIFTPKASTLRSQTADSRGHFGHGSRSP